MKYAKPTILALSSQASGWCNVGSSGENVDNNCTPGAAPTTLGCSGGGANTTGHCKSGSSVKNLAPGLGLTYCLTGTGRTIGDIPCTARSNAGGATACKTGSLACHCTTGTTA